MQKFGRYIGIAVSVCCQSFGIPARRQKKFAEVGFKCVGMRGLYMRLGISPHTVTHLTSGSAHETQNFSASLRKL